MTFSMAEERALALVDAWALRPLVTCHEPDALRLVVVATCHGCGGPVTIRATGRDTDQRAARVVECRRGGCKAGIIQINYLYGVG